MKWRSANDEYIIFKRSGAGGYSTSKNGGFFPVSYIWFKFNNNIEFIGYNRKYYNRIHTININRSPRTFKLTAHWQIEKRHKHCDAWVRTKAVKPMPVD